MKASNASLTRRERGAATLAVVMVLFFIMAMVAAYTNRNMIFEQRTSANSYRAAQAMAAGDAGLEWTMAMLNGGAIDDACASAVGTSDFRSRYLSVLDNGAFAATLTAAGASLQPSCIATAGGWSCSCPSNGAPSLSPEFAPVFTSVIVADSTRPGLVLVRTRGCDAPRSGKITADTANDAGACHIEKLTNDYGASIGVKTDSQQTLRSSLGLVSAMPVAPAAALTVRGDVDQSAANLNVINADAQTGLALRAGGLIVNPAFVQTAGPAGSSTQTLQDSDASIGSIDANDFLRQSLGLTPDLYGQQPAAVRISCAGTCLTSALTFNGTDYSLAQLVSRYPSRVIYIDGNLSLNTAGTFGTAAPMKPVMLVVKGNLSVDQPIVFNGVIFTVGGFDLKPGGSGSQINGALVVGEDFTGAANVAVAYNSAVVHRIRYGFGSFVRVPGSWRTEPGYAE